MKKIILLALSIFVLNSVQAQDDAFSEGKMIITGGYGFPNLYKSILKAALAGAQLDPGESYDLKGFGPGFGKFEYAVSDNVGIGASMGYFNTALTLRKQYSETDYDYNTGTYYTSTYEDVYKYKFSSFSLGVRLNFHFGTTAKLDPYAGIAAGYTKHNFSMTYTTTNPSGGSGVSASISPVPLYLGLTAGVRYYFTPNIGLYTELGIEKWSVLQGGIAIKL